MSENQEEANRIDFMPLSVPLSEIPIALVNRIEREREKELESVHVAFSTILKLTLRMSCLTWDSIRYLCATTTEDPARRLEFALVVPPLARTILDSLFTIIHLFDNSSINARKFIASGWRESSEEHQRLLARHGEDPEWAQWLVMHSKTVSLLEEDAAITQAEKNEPRKLLKYWPNPGRMKNETKDPRRRAFLEFLDDWFYGRLSGDSHLNFSGIIRTAIHLSDPARSQVGRKNLEIYKWNVVFTSVSIYVALLSEIAGQFRFEHEIHRLHKVWQHLLKSPYAESMYKQRYEKWLSSNS